MIQCTETEKQGKIDNLDCIAPSCTPMHINLKWVLHQKNE